MSRQLNNPNTRRDYGATSSSQLPDVNFSGFSPTEFMSLSEDIALNITSISSSWKQLEKLGKIIGTPKDQQNTRDRIHNINETTNQRIKDTSRELQRLHPIARRGDKQQKLQLEKLASDFQAVVEKYSDAQKRISVSMKKTFTQQQLQQQEGYDAQSSDREALLQQRQRQMEAGLQFEQDMLMERERQITQIEADILDVNSIMRTVSRLVHEQSENVEQIESSIENTATNVELGRDELAKAAEHRQSYRRKVLILLVIAVIIGLIVTGVIVSKLK